MLEFFDESHVFNSDQVRELIELTKRIQSPCQTYTIAVGEPSDPSSVLRSIWLGTSSEATSEAFKMDNKEKSFRVVLGDLGNE